MSGVAAATVGVGVLGYVGSQNAANKQSGAAGAATALEKEQFDYQKAMNAPYQEAGVKALSGMQDKRFQTDFNRDQFKTSPGYQFSLEQGNNALKAAQAATGNQVSGAGMAALEKYNVGTADQEYQQAFENYQNQQNNQFGRLSTLAAGGAGANSAMGNAASNYAKGASSNIMNAGKAQAAGDIGMTNALGQTITGLSNFAGTKNPSVPNNYGNGPMSAQQTSDFNMLMGN